MSGNKWEGWVVSSQALQSKVEESLKFEGGWDYEYVYRRVGNSTIRFRRTEHWGGEWANGMLWKIPMKNRKVIQF